MKTIGVGEFKAKCLGLVSEVEAKRETVVVTKYGKPVARLMPMELAEDVDPLEVFRFPGVIVIGDIMSPMYTDAELDEFERASLAQLNDPS
jgi:prevent-host-death family protein